MPRRLSALCAALLAAVLMTACGSTTHPATIPVKPGAVPPPAKAAPSCSPQNQKEIQAGKGNLSSCTPTTPQASVGYTLAASTSPAGATGPDTSNNDPIALSSWRAVRAHGHPFGYVKVNQGTGFIDRDAASQFAGMRRASVKPGGYDFLEVCRTLPGSEARLFAGRLRTLGTRGSLVPVGDAEWPLSVPCSVTQARNWLISWTVTVHSLLGRWPAIYTGAWWSNPNLGCWRPPHALRWVSGYITRSRLPIPCGWGGVDLWQYTDHGYNGAIFSDMSALEVPLARLAGGLPLTQAQLRAELWHLYRVRTAERAQVALFSGLLTKYGCRPPYRVHVALDRAALARYRRRACPVWKHHGEATHKELRTLAGEITALHRKGVR